MEVQRIELGNVGAGRTFDLEQSICFNSAGIYFHEYGTDSRTSSAYYSDQQVQDIITTLSYYKLIRQREGEWKAND
jgi:hypothetical protein